jgi:hypothetical protein
VIKQIVCDCGWTATGAEQELIVATQEHGRDAHGLIPTPEQVLAIATPVATEDVTERKPRS